MDAISNFAYNINNELLTGLSLLLDNHIIFVFVIVALVLINESRNTKRLKIFIALFLAFLFATCIKILTGVERPCAFLDVPNCPSSSSFPSLHATLAFVVMISFLNKRSYWIFVLFALFVSLTRLVLAVHSFRDIAAALPIALITYNLVDVFWRSFLWKRLK